MTRRLSSYLARLFMRAMEWRDMFKILGDLSVLAGRDDLIRHREQNAILFGDVQSEKPRACGAAQGARLKVSESTRAAADSHRLR